MARYLWLLETNTPAYRVAVELRMADNLTKARCKTCWGGSTPGHRLGCSVRLEESKCAVWSRAYVLDHLPMWTPNTLAAILVRANEEYWHLHLDPTTLSDVEYDIVQRTLASRDPAHPQLEYVGPGADGYAR